jgi:hypothetical protein
MACLQVLDNCAHVDRLIHRLAVNGKYLAERACLDAEDEEDIKRALVAYKQMQQQQQQGEDGLHGGVSRNWCAVS